MRKISPTRWRLNSTSFNLARLVGPAAAGLLISAVGTGWVFLINAGSYAVVITSLACLRTAELHVRVRTPRSWRSFTEGFAYVGKRPDLKAILLMMFLIGTFGMNYPIFISTMSVKVLPCRRQRIWRAVVDDGDRLGHRRPAGCETG